MVWVIPEKELLVENLFGSFLYNQYFLEVCLETGWDGVRVRYELQGRRVEDIVLTNGFTE